MRSLGLATDLLALGAAAEVERHPDRIVVRTPGEPDFWSGNVLIRLTPPEAPEREEARFRADFPEAAHLRVEWDDPELDPEALRAPWAALGAEVEVDDVLVREGPPPARPVPEGYAVRLLDPASEEDWAGAVRLALAVEVEEGCEAASHLPYLRRRFAGRRALARAGALRWWGAFREGAMAAQMGLVEGDVDGRALARFQHVDTHPNHRRRGLCAALLAHVGAAARAPSLVIMAEAGGNAGRIYRRAGFSWRERVVGVQRRGC